MTRRRSLPLGATASVSRSTAPIRTRLRKSPMRGDAPRGGLVLRVDRARYRHGGASAREASDPDWHNRQPVRVGLAVTRTSPMVPMRSGYYCPVTSDSHSASVPAPRPRRPGRAGNESRPGRVTGTTRGVWSCKPLHPRHRCRNCQARHTAHMAAGPGPQDSLLVEPAGARGFPQIRRNNQFKFSKLGQYIL